MLTKLKWMDSFRFHEVSETQLTHDDRLILFMSILLKEDHHPRDKTTSLVS